MNGKIKKLALSLCFILIFGFVLEPVSQVMERKESQERYSEFWEEPKEYDVWFLGTSHVYYAMQPMELWKQYGIRSYNLGAPSSQMPQTYWTMMCALQYSKPEVIVLDTYKVQDDTQHQEKKKQIHTGMDSIPLSPAKIKGIFDIFDTWGDRFEYICGFSIYHNRWEELTEGDFNVQIEKAKGARFFDWVVDKSDFQKIDEEEMSDTDTIGFIYLRKIIEECKERGIKLILTDIPLCKSKNVQRGMNAVAKVAEEYDVDYMNMRYNEDLIDYGVDFADNGHVNLFGTKKVTKYMGDYLVQHCELTDYRKDTEKAKEWDEDYEEYRQYKLERMRSTDKLKAYVQWLGEDDYTCYIYQKEKPDGLLGREFASLKNAVYISLEEAREKLGTEIGGEYAFIVENAKGEVLDRAVFKNRKRV